MESHTRGDFPLTTDADTLLEMMKRIEKRAPEYLALFAAETEDKFDSALDGLLDKAIRHLEKNKVNFSSLNEESLSAVLAGALSVPGLAVTQESHSNGHVDIFLEAYLCTPTRTRLAEAKIYDGPAYHIAGLTQLLGRYLTGREGRGLLINYVRKRDIKGLIAKLRKELDVDLPLKQQGASVDHTMLWSFETTHLHSAGERLRIGHIGCNLYSGEGDT
jgi:hypothetical protein